ncbi:cysteine hydrolase family protein [Natranaerofaba carboxydovora]|uniref:cysteine hydrolase family protein n=1 Tax=Natranaerofaba carboxydovora TaxID=2742683 RepID=UPI001F12C7C4|nr:isochorismatase family cysteine hydrolase [Natranaerofaba carboxydovora]UMZ73158.1 Isochorismatase family protein [Natranaerofaba carboxydovora]
MGYLEDNLGELQVEKTAGNTIVENSKDSALIIVDMLKGFCDTGPLQSPYNHALAGPIASLVKKWEGPIVSIQDAHDEDDKEFNSFPPHCVDGSKEAEVVEPILDALQNKEYEVVKKQTLSPFFGAWNFEDWLVKQQGRGIKEYYVVGNCTDLCIYQTAMGMKMWFAGNKEDVSVNVIVNLVDTYDLPLEETPDGVSSHPRELFNRVFLHHMSLNSINLIEIDLKFK